MDIKITFIYFVFFEVIQTQQHKHHNGISEDVYHHHSETLRIIDIERLIAAIEREVEKEIELDVETDSHKMNKRIFFKSRKEVGAPDIWEALRREKKRNAKQHTRSRLM